MDDRKRERMSPRPRSVRTKKLTESQRREKQRIHNRLWAFKVAWGPGAFAHLEEVSGGKITAAELRAMMDGEKYGIDMWRMAGTALDRTQGSGDNPSAPCGGTST